MGSVRPGGLALVASLLLFWSVFPPAVGQSSQGHMTVATDYELFGPSDLQGGGHVTWTLTGSKAVEFRAKVIHMFDEYDIIPTGFSAAGAPIPRNRDGKLDVAEGLVYTDLLEVMLERRTTPLGTSVQYMNLYPFDLREENPGDRAAGFQRSTAGLAGQDLNSTADAVIRFLFQASSTTTNARVTLATPVLADAPYAFFSYEVRQSPTLSASFPYPDLWPFLHEGGWHNVTTADGKKAMWVGNDTTGAYENNTIASARTSADPALALSSSFYVPFDLRFASHAYATFNYTGQVADANDRLRLQVAEEPSLTTWTNLSFGPSVTDLPSTPLGIWVNATVGLDAYLGERVRLRLNFTSDAAGNGPGFFIRDFALHAPADYEGEVVETDSHYLVGTLSFSDPVLPSGGIQLIRTPGGEILYYSSTWDTTALPADSIRFRTFDVTENPQVLFAVMLVASYAISLLQEGAYDRYREAHPSVYRPAVHRVKWLHNLGRVAIGVLVLFYFVPTALGVIGIRIFVSGPAYWFLSLTLALLVGFVTRAYYRQKLDEAPPPVVGEAPVLRSRETAPPPPEPAIAVAHCTVREKKVVSMRCESCGELQVIPEGADPRTVACERCGGRLRHLDEGKRYLIVASNPAIAFAWMQDLTKEGKPSLCLSPAAPDRLRLEFGDKDVQFLQVSSQATNAIDPRKLDPAGLKAILPLARQGKGGVILYDGLDRIISEASMGDVIRFLRKANDMAFVHGVTVIGRVSPRVLADPDLRRLRAEFDEYMDLSAQM
ncbi:MAG: DUF835 domain-containing protein [Methanobacteriota archaeon]|nr:MAG: DUF835 domain-containing protein [Euryarchaeota archaeon]